MDPRQKMLAQIRAKYGLDDSLVFAVMAVLPREEFAPQEKRFIAYEDRPIPIGYSQTMSQPYTVAFMTHLLQLKGGEKVLEIGTGSGYQTAILAKIAKEVYTIEIVPQLARRARNNLTKLGLKNIRFKTGSGEAGWKQFAPFDRILVTAGIGNGMPKNLLDQLARGGIVVAPIGKGEDQQMTRFTRVNGKIKKEEFGVFRFVPFVRDTIA